MKNFYRKQFSNYLGEQRAILDIVIGFTPNPSQTPTPSPTATLQITPSPTGTNTPTPSITASATATLTPTPTNTATNTPTPTNTGTPTQTPTNTGTPTPTMTPSSSPAVPYQSAVLEVECIGGILLGGDSITVDGAPYPLTTSGGTIGVAGCVNILVRNGTGIIYRMFYGPNSQVCTSPGNTYDEVRLVNFQYNPAIGLMGGYDYTEQLYMSGVLVGGSVKQTAIVNPPADLGNGCATQDLDLVVTFFVETILPTPTPSVTQTQTPTSTPNPVCPQQINIVGSISGNDVTGLYDRQYTYSGGSFTGAWIEGTLYPNVIFYTGAFTGDGRTYAVYTNQSGSTFNTLIFSKVGAGTEWYRIYRTTSDYIFNGGTPIGSFGLNPTPFDEIEIDGVWFPRTGSYLPPSDIILSYPSICPTPTPTPTISVTPSVTPPSVTPTSTPTPTETTTPTPTPTNAGPITPASYNDLLFWNDYTDTGTTLESSGRLYKMIDSGNGDNYFSQDDTARQPYVVDNVFGNYQGLYSFSAGGATNQYIEKAGSDTFTNPAEYTMFAHFAITGTSTPGSGYNLILNSDNQAIAGSPFSGMTNRYMQWNTANFGGTGFNMYNVIFPTGPGVQFVPDLFTGQVFDYVPGEWYKIAFRTQQSGPNVIMDMFVDGVSAFTSSSVGTLTAPNQNIALAYGMQGYITEQFMYSRALTDFEISSLFTNYLDVKYPFDTDAEIYLNKVVTTATTVGATVSAATNNLFIQLKDSGLYNKLEAFYPIISLDPDGQSINGKGNDAFNVTWNGSTFHGYSGASPISIATGNYGNTNFSPSVDATLMTDDSLHISLYNGLIGDGNGEMGTIESFGGNRLFILTNYAGYTTWAAGNDDSTNITTGASPIDNRGMWIMNREDSSTATIYQNGVSYLSNGLPNSAGLPTGEIHLIGISQAGSGNWGTTYPMRVQFATIGSGLTSTEVTQLTNIVNDFQKALSRNTF